MRKFLYISVIVTLLLTVANDAVGKAFTLVIDAGHGGHDSGAVGAYSKEKDINLYTALAFGRYVERNCPDVNVIYTRKTDVFVTLHGRADIANRAKADLFISIHTNSVPGSKTARGLETYTLGMHRASDNLDVAKRENSVILVEKDYKQHYEGFDPNSAESYIIFEFMQDHNMAKSVDMAKQVQTNVSSIASRPNKGVKQAGFLVLRETSMPSCLIELGFISTPSEEQYLNNKTNIDNIARGLYNAFVAYKRKYDSNSPVIYKKETAKAEEKDSVTEVAPKETTRVESPRAASTRSRSSEKVTAAVAEEKNAVAEEASAKQLKAERKQSSSSASGAEAKAKAEAAKPDTAGRPVFKVQIMANDKVLPKNSSKLKGHTNAAYYKENGMVKYTLGESTNYNEILKLNKELTSVFPGCFIVAFKNGEKMNVNQAIREFLKKKK